MGRIVRQPADRSATAGGRAGQTAKAAPGVVGAGGGAGGTEQGGAGADGHGNSVPRFHITWGTGPEVVRVFAEPVLEGERKGLV
uniref:hypothetical protein n=1 Tax=Nocardia cyriacigeorgica TaxID=135487 RepID=UPI002458F905